MLLGVPADLNVSTIEELIAKVKAAPGNLNYASVTGANDLLFTAFLKRDLGVVEGMKLRTDVDDPILQALFDFLRTLRPVRE